MKEANTIEVEGMFQNVKTRLAKNVSCVKEKE